MVIKMTLFCILLTFVFVSVSENDDVTYKKIVFLTNAAIEQAFAKNDLTVGNNSRANGLEHIIEKIIDDWYTYWSFAEINMMIAAPDKLDLADHRSALSRFFPRTDSEGLNLTTLAEHRRRRVKTALKNIFRRKLGPKYNQFMMQLKLEVRNTLIPYIAIPEANEISEDLGRLNLTTLIEERRLTGTSIANTIRRGVLGTDTSEVVEEESGSVPNVFLWRLCRLIGLYISAQFPRSYIRQLWSDPDDNTCILDDGTTLRRFKKINDLWWQLSPITRGAVNII
ncbi:uncharacterized protein LOC126847032 isoform X3 [Adelges cooleyi]|uniref:uncharacterized protein LOC126847032 isoform X3 n=1 Tax=Adelges cooleyi TaxID=133065 RepID=UPI0021809705|nr:uncharacterized protein LOC126847032 isoform X3 [Adelges cooleyi]